MGKIEIERKYLIDGSAFRRAHPLVTGDLLYQGYFSDGIRVRVGQDTAWLTIKGKTDKTKIGRPEYEYAIPHQDGVELIELCSAGKLKKTRYRIPHGGNTWEVDEFFGPLIGLWLAEIELKTADQSFEVPKWVREEVSTDKRYSNASLAKNGKP